MLSPSISPSTMLDLLNVVHQLNALGIPDFLIYMSPLVLPALLGLWIKGTLFSSDYS